MYHPTGDGTGNEWPGKQCNYLSTPGQWVIVNKTDDCANTGTSTQVSDKGFKRMSPEVSQISSETEKNNFLCKVRKQLECLLYDLGGGGRREWGRDFAKELQGDPYSLVSTPVGNSRHISRKLRWNVNCRAFQRRWDFAWLCKAGVPPLLLVRIHSEALKPPAVKMLMESVGCDSRANT